MECIILIKYGIDEKNAIDITQIVLDNYCKKNIIQISAVELIPFLFTCINNNIPITNTIYDNIIYNKMSLCNLFIIINDRKFILKTNCRNNIKINLKSFIKSKVNKNNIIIYPHAHYREGDGGINVMYFLAKKLEESGKNVRIYPCFGNIQNPHYNKYYNEDFDITDCIVIYCEGTVGNPLCARYSIRWMLSELGKNVPYEYVYSWDKQELVYYFNTENRIENSMLSLKGTVYKLLPLLIIPSMFKNKNYSRVKNSTCFTIRKGNHMRKQIDFIHNKNSFEIKGQTHIEMLEIFNQYEKFVCYDPATFIMVMAALCGCISIVVPMPNISKIEWLKTTAAYRYLSNKNIDGYYGIAYGIEDIKWAKSTIHLVEEQWKDIINYNNTFYETFIEDLNHLDDGTLQNTVENNYLK
jgi:hypothetical protein